MASSRESVQKASTVRSVISRIEALKTLISYWADSEKLIFLSDSSLATLEIFTAWSHRRSKSLRV